MGICAEELRQWVIKPTLKRIGQYSKAAENLLIATAAQESQLGEHIKRQGQRGLGIYQINSLAHRHIWDDYLAQRPDLASVVRGLASQRDFLNHPHTELATNLCYATAIAWLMYSRHENFELPNVDDAESMAKCWKRYFHPKTTVSLQDFIDSYHHYEMEEAA